MGLSLAQTLPLDVLLLICQLATDPHPNYYAHGGRLPGSRWDSNESVHPLTLVCRNWTGPANAVLYASVSVLDGTVGCLFRRTIAHRPSLARQVKRLVLGLKDKEDDLAVFNSDTSSSQSRVPSFKSGSLVETEDEACADSLMLAQILYRCDAVRRLQIRRALHRAARETVLPIITSREYDILICAPRLVGTTAKWGDGFYQPEDVLALAQRSLSILELECTLPTHQVEINDSNLAATLQLRGLRLECNIQPNLLRDLLRRAHQLEYLDLYTERSTTADYAFCDTLAEVESTLKGLKFLVNPPLGQEAVVTTPTEEMLAGSYLPGLKALVSATISSAEVSPATLLQSLPLSLKSLKILAFGQSFMYHPNLLQALKTRHLPLGAFAEWQVTGSDWTDAQVREVTEACDNRQIRFVWTAGTSEGESLSTGSSGAP